MKWIEVYDMENEQNYVELWGAAADEPQLSHENHGRRFFKFPLRVERLSGLSDFPIILASEAQLEEFPVHTGDALRVTGSLRSFNNKSGRGNRLLLSVLAQTLTDGTNEHFNRILLSGTLCKTPVLRRTPLGRSICDIVLAVNRRYGRSDYLPCIAWGQLAALLAEKDVGAHIVLEGRVQSRNYNKTVDGIVQQRTAYEVSIMQLPEEAQF